MKKCKNCKTELTDSVVEYVEEEGCEYCMQKCDICGKIVEDREITELHWGDLCEECLDDNQEEK